MQVSSTGLVMVKVEGSPYISIFTFQTFICLNIILNYNM